MKPANKHALIVTLALFAVAGCLMAVATNAGAATTLRLEATSRAQVWRSPNVLDDRYELSFAIKVNGRAVDRRGNVEGRCRYTLFTRRLALEIANCGRSRLKVRYIGSTRFTFTYRERR